MEIIEKLDVMEGGACHQYLDGPRDDFQSMASIGEYGDEWWTNQQQRQRFQLLFVPEGIAFNGKGFVGTRVTAPAFSYLRPIESGNERLVAQICPRWNRLQPWFELVGAGRSTPSV